MTRQPEIYVRALLAVVDPKKTGHDADFVCSACDLLRKAWDEHGWPTKRPVLVLLPPDETTHGYVGYEADGKAGLWRVPRRMSAKDIGL